MPGRLGRSRPNRPILLRNPSFQTAGNVGGSVNVTLDAFTSAATGSFGTSSGWPSVVGSGGGATGGNVVHMVTRLPRRIRRPTRVR